MTTAVEASRKAQFAWSEIAWFGALATACYAPVLLALVRQWDSDPDMSHGFSPATSSGRGGASSWL